MRRLRLTVLLASAAIVALAGCTDPSPDAPTAQETSSSIAPSEDASTEPSTETTSTEAEPFFGSASNTGGGGTVCLDDGEPVQATLSTVLTASTPITIDSVTLTPASPDVEIVDQFVLPYDGGLGGLTFGDYPPDDRDGERADAAGYQLDSSETITIGVGFEIAEDPGAADMTLGITYKFAGSGDTEELESTYGLVLADDCNPNG